MLDPKNFYNEIEEWHQKTLADVEANFAKLTAYISKLCPAKLLSQLSLNYLFVPGGEFREESDEIHTWSRWIEFLAGIMFLTFRGGDLFMLGRIPFREFFPDMAAIFNLLRSHFDQRKHGSRTSNHFSGCAVVPCKRGFQ